MRVLMILFRDIHSDARVQQEAVALAQMGWEVDIACVKTTVQPTPDLHERVRLLRFTIQTKRLKRLVDRQKDQRMKRGVYRVIRNPLVKLAKDVVAQRQFSFRVVSLCEDSSYDVIHCHDPYTLSIGGYLKRKLGARLVYDSHELFNEPNSKNRWERAIGYRAESFWINHVDHLIAGNEFMAKELEARYSDVKTTVVRSIPDSIDQLPDDEEKHYFHQSLGLEPDAKVILYHGTFVKNSGLEELIASLKYLPSIYKAVLMGDGVQRETLEVLIQENNLERRVYFHSLVPPQEMLELIAHAHVGVALQPSQCINHRLATPNKIFEYIQAGLPVVASDQPGNSIVIGTYKAGLLVDPLDVQGISRAIEEIVTNPLPYFIGTLRARKEMTWEKERNQLIELYQGIEQERQAVAVEMDKVGEELVSIKPRLREL
ncbi:Glycosyltransferase involved in cell wall bisynthesis [Marininema mesophilum]|uniref:Glycosyltransferase involved in cell wall bisynthesis n=1 Tax=Marininema mesophilum TaxID=1048340 RepID=A0A1H2X661_9BACL|nr:glycosyltransferase family 4 protein [Marininema mesophilum]SDW88258.1 Glycosyltransferase involved in cell wall bisynthesis [Marininema mesophilum]